MQGNERQAATPGQHEIFRQEWVRWQPRIYAYIRTLIFNRSDAEDLLQEVAEVLWQKIDQFEPGTRFDQWAFAVARNRTLSFQRKMGRERVKFTDSLDEVLSAEAVAMATDGNDLASSLESCVAKLSTDQRELLSQRYQPDATNRSVARAVGKSESAISRTMNAIYGLLMSCIEASS
ncbi:MAG: RNA polymerase sigma-70 factor (ECF subfamily) [Pirellulaceae bacterium]|jgi:RNA polymerase sigma-70 factor (ECF subfamily)